MARPVINRGAGFRAVLTALLVCALSGVTPARAALEFYLEADGIPAASSSESAPSAAFLPNHDPARDSFPGLVIQKGGVGALETDPLKFQQWVGPSGGVTIDGPVEFRFWAAMKDFATGKRGVVEAFLLDCDSGGSNCLLIAQANRDIFQWNSSWGSWREHSIEFGEITQTISPGRAPSIKIVVGADAGDDMWFAYGSEGYPARVTDSAVSDIVIDGSFGDWTGPGGMQVDIVDEGGADDWSNPARLDITWFAVSTNLVDAFHILMGSDDSPASDVVVASLIDTDLDNDANYVLVATVDGTDAVVELFSCDDTLPDGCNGEALVRTYPSSFYQVGSSLGPWGQDTLLEMVLPFDDLQGDVLVMTGLVSYAANSLLISPKDTIFGVSGQAATDRIYYDPGTGQATLITELGSNYMVRRHGNPWEVRGADPMATVLSAPFDDLPGTLGDGQIYYYVMERETGVPVSISAHPNTASDSVRLGFDDHDALSAPVHAALSSVSVSDPSSIQADGTSFVTVTVVPLDSNGVRIGGGCELDIDQVQLSPGVMAGPVEDHFNGIYSFKVTSISTGTAQVKVSVEGVALNDAPQIGFN